ncbi:type I-F CRISPR-associated protein Cas7f/Csy3 [Burkholderia multivorans]|uniref:type I-F CRISPR-associated protein Cas7f/Csy3 n=1 Tax=Burkholderia multivorans TaxID=87883 RepID=UPI001C23F61F|nr:type I-F CRISPR-associated protein Cas7f/Csy3 [Burkholderia multivorans]MBU9200173.1 type I-F CRISPR-associated protein Cas7f/Csy3 [Burkholderia multivorans]MDN8078705.1 type I-F CRISPR-associated protein Cas7f/Csy3 [Burkholderia multivorans]
MSKKTAGKAHTAASMYAVTGTIDPTHFRFFQANESQISALIARNEGVSPFRNLDSVLVRTHCGYVGTNATALTDSNKLKVDEREKREQTNPGARDLACLDADKDYLVVAGSIKFVANYFAPSRTDNHDMSAYQADFVAQYIADGHFPALIKRYLANIVNGAALWRNQYGFDRKTVTTLKLPGVPARHFVVENEKSAEFFELAELLAANLQKPGAWALLDVAMLIQLGFDAEVYPSQPFIQPEEKLKIRGVPKDANYGRMLETYPDAEGRPQVVLTKNKIGNALRRVDTSYVEDAAAPIAIELYGTVAVERKAYRLDAGNDYFSLVSGKTYETMTQGERDYVMGVFLKGGLLNFAQEK